MQQVADETPLYDAPHRRRLRRVGLGLFGIALIDLAVIAYCVTHRVEHGSSIGVAALVAAPFVFHGSLRAASLVRWLAAGLLAVLLVVVPAIPLIVPVDLLIVWARLHPTQAAAGTIYAFGLTALCVVLIRELGHESIMAARAAAGRRRRNLLIPAAFGFVLAASLTGAAYYVTHGRAARHAAELAAANLGPGYRYFCTHLSLHWHRDAPRRSYYAQVVAWKENEIVSGPVSWEE